jgi:hypothetical protein
VTRVRAAAGVVAVLVVAGAAIAVADPFAGTGHAKGAADDAAPTARASVKEGTLSSQVNQDGTLGYAAKADGSPYAVVNQARGTFTWLPSVGRVVARGEMLYRVGDDPVVLLYGDTPVYRALSEGMSGPDVRELNANLVALGYASRDDLDPDSDDFGSTTASALRKLQRHLDVDDTGTLELGQAVFLPGPLRITKVSATLGTMARPGMPIAQATSTRRQVVVDLDASQQSGVKVGDDVVVTLPDKETTPGVVSRIGTVASSSGNGQGGSDSSQQSTTIPIYVRLKHPHVAGDLDQAPVQVQITTARVQHALIVPVTALLARAGGGYAVETVDARGVHRDVPVTLGVFDDADGLVQVTGSLTAGQRIVVPAT